jgi:two-component system OmpR family response regulator
MSPFGCRAAPQEPSRVGSVAHVSVMVDHPPALEPLRVIVVTLVTTPHTQAVVAELRRGAMQVELRTVDVLDREPDAAVYLVSLEPPAHDLIDGRGPPPIVSAAEWRRGSIDPLVSWANRSELRPGLIGLIEHGGPADAETLLAAGFDDAAVAPVSPRELAARVRAVHRRVHWKGVANGRLRFGELTLDLYGRALWFRGKTIALTSIELAVLRELIKARGRPLSRIELLDRAWGEEDLEVSERAVDNVILRLRRKLPEPDVIETVRSVGFRLASS